MSTAVHAAFEAQVDRQPDATAVIAGTVRLTYRELDERANRLAHRLREAGIRPETPIAFLLERDETPVIAILSILKAGCNYVPIEPAYPADRRAYIIENSRAHVVITPREMAATLPAAANVIFIDDDLGA
ncbi:hypothetical protein BH11MYX2_BH11MYX2_32390 [soil metagenome]